MWKFYFYETNSNLLEFYLKKYILLFFKPKFVIRINRILSFYKKINLFFNKYDAIPESLENFKFDIILN